MAKTKQSDVWHKPIKNIGNGYIDLILAIVDQNGSKLAGHGLGISTTAGSATAFVSADPDWLHLTLAEDVVDDDVFCLARKKGASIRHNQKLAGAYDIGSLVYKTADGTWDHADHGVAQSLLMECGIVCGPADRITGGDVKTIDDALSATEGVDICI